MAGDRSEEYEVTVDLGNYSPGKHSDQGRRPRLVQRMRRNLETEVSGPLAPPREAAGPAEPRQGLRMTGALARPARVLPEVALDVGWRLWTLVDGWLCPPMVRYGSRFGRWLPGREHRATCLAHTWPERDSPGGSCSAPRSRPSRRSIRAVAEPWQLDSRAGHDAAALLRPGRRGRTGRAGRDGPGGLLAAVR